MLRRTFLQAALAPPRRRPNVVFVFPDQWRAQAFGYAGDPNAHTPSIDALARESCNFQNAVSGFPVCSPYRASLMTGQYAVRHGLLVNDVELRPNGPTLGATFRRSGYSTAYIGKWHIHGSPDGNFGRRLAYVPPEARFGFERFDACECTHDYNHSLYYSGDDPTQRFWPGYDAIAQTQAACDFIRDSAAKSDPYFLMLSLGPPHDPYHTAPEKYQALYRDRQIKLRPNVPATHAEEAVKTLKGYYAHMAALDGCIAQLRQAIAQSPNADDTLFVFTSDHGDMLQSQGLHHKQQPWDESCRVPFLVHYPRLRGRSPGRSQTPIDAPDILPTLCALAGLDIPESVQGRNYAPLIAGREKDDPQAAALLNLPVSFSVVRRQGFAEYRGLRTPRHTYVRSIHGPWLLYDNQVDPYQMRNLVDSQPALRSQLDRLLDARLKQAGDDFLPGARYVERARATHYREVNAPVGRVESPWRDWRSTWQ